MKLTSLTMHNMFSYYGTSTMYFDNISCIVGTNGLGKTSILNSIKLCLGSSNIDINSVLNNNAKDNKCWVDLNFDEFRVQRVWAFEEKAEETLTVTYKNGEELESVEAEHFLQNKIPNFIVDFLFYDGEVGDNLLLLSNTKLRSIFDYIFDLDLLVNTAKDAHEVAKRLLEKNKDAQTEKLVELENKRLHILETISGQKDELKTKQKEYKKLDANLKKLQTTIKNKNKKTKALIGEKEKLQSKLDSKALKFKEITLWQMPLLLNSRLYDKLQQKNASALQIEDESLFTSKFHKFAQEIQSPLDENELLDLFQSMMLGKSSTIELTTSKQEFKFLIHEMNSLKIAIKELEANIKTIQSSEMEHEMMSSLLESYELQEKQLSALQQELQDLEGTIEQNSLKSKEINKTLTKAFKKNQHKYAFIKGYEELQIIANVSSKLYKQKLSQKLEIFNQKLKENTSQFLSQYKHIQEIFIDTQHRIIVTDEKREKLNTGLLSAGQKQILNFLIIKTILDFKEFASFVMVDTPFGRLSNKNKKLLLNNCYQYFDNLILLLTDSEFEFIQSQKLKYKHYEIKKDNMGSSIEEIA